MNIWLLTTEYPPYYGGGISVYCDHTARMFAEKGDYVTVFIPDQKMESEEEEVIEGNIRIIRFKPGQHPIYRYMGYTAALSYDMAMRVENRIKEEGAPDIIESQDYTGLAYFLIHRKKELNKYLKSVPISINLHTPKFILDEIQQSPVYNFPHYWIGEMERYVLRSADVLISPSQFLKDTLFHKLKFDFPIFVIPNPYQVDEEENHQGEIVANTYRAGNMVFLGRVQYFKGIEHLINNLIPFWQKGLEMPLEVMGGDSYYHPKQMNFIDYLKKKYKKYVDEKLILFRGLLPPDQVKNGLERANLIFVPSLFESFSYAVIEAMSLGKIVLASDSGGQRELIQSGVNGFLFSHGDRAGFKESMDTFLRMNEADRMEMGKRAKEHVRALLSYDRIYPMKMEVWQDAIRQHRLSRTYSFIRPIPRIEKVEEGEVTLEKDLLSVVVPFYNMGKWIEETLNSLVKSDYINLEIILVNDGSTDEESVQILEELENKYPIRIIHKENGGLVSARNEGVKHVRGEFLAFLDADDKVDAKYYTKAVELLKHYENVSFVGCWTQYFEESDALWPTWDPEPPYFLVHNTLNSSALVYKTKDFLNHGWNDPDMVFGMEDYESAMKMVEAGYRGVVLTEPLFYYRIRKDSMSRQFNVDNQVYLYRLITEKHKEFYQQYAVEVFNLLNVNGPGYLYDNPTWELPRVGFVTNQSSGNVTFDSMAIPFEVKEKMVRLWGSRRFRKLLNIFFKLKLDRFLK